MANRHHKIPFALLLVVLLALFGIPACSDDEGDGTGDGDGGGQYDAGRDSGGPGGDDGWAPTDPGYDAGYDAGGSDPGGQDAGYDAGTDTGPADHGMTDICDEVNMDSTPIKPNVLLVVDKSGSMNDPTVQGGLRTKIQDTKDALNTILTFGEGKIRFGWLQFPSDAECGPGPVSVPCTENVTQIRTMVLQIQPLGGTPTGESLENALAYQDLHDENRDNFIILLTDGVPTCPNGRGRENTPEDNFLALQALENLHAQNIDTFVIGLGEDLNNTNPGLLNQFAVAGGRPRPGNPQYYPANSLAELEQAFIDIISSVMSCELQLDRPPDIPDWLWVFFDGVAVERDYNHINGWDYDEPNNKIIFYGPACDLLRSGQVNLVEVKVGCGPPV